MKEYTYGDHTWKALTGDEAKRKIEIQNDAGFLDANFGVINVSQERWKMAQEAEKNGWMNLWRNATIDRNDEHFIFFDRYAHLNGATFEHAIELGCGPFTNLRFVGGVGKIRQCSLLDPLLNDYLQHPHCTYKQGSLQTISGGSIKVAEGFAVPLEQYKVDRQYDLVVMINVVQHCYDVRLVFKKIYQMLSENGVLIFSDCYYDHESVKEAVVTSWDQGHPLQVDRKVYDGFMDTMFRPIFKKRVISSTFHGANSDYFYFIGQK